MPKVSDENLAQKHLQFAVWELDPFCKLTLSQKAEKLNVTTATLFRWRRDPLYVMRKNQLRDASFEQYAGDVDKSVIRAAVGGSFLHQKLFYEKKGELIRKTQAIPLDDIKSLTPEEKQKEIDKLIAETTPLESGANELPSDS